VSYLTAWAVGLRREYNVTLDFIGLQVRKNQVGPEVCANFSPLQLYSYRGIPWANLHILDQPDTFLARRTRARSQAALRTSLSRCVNRWMRLGSGRR
jgi:hypothetical protein